MFINGKALSHQRSSVLTRPRAEGLLEILHLGMLPSPVILFYTPPRHFGVSVCRCYRLKLNNVARKMGWGERAFLDLSYPSMPSFKGVSGSRALTNIWDDNLSAIRIVVGIPIY